MSRYKFRVFSRHTNRIEYLSEDDYGVIIDGADGYEVMQWIGASDREGFLIYEKDVVLCRQEDPFDCSPSIVKKVVGWNQKCLQYRLYNHPSEISKAAGETFWAVDVEVIGNAFDWRNEQCRYFLDESVKHLVTV